jgi:hypothetical protein
MLHKITYKGISLLYDSNLSCGDSMCVDFPGRIFEIEKELDRWRNSLPEELSIRTATTIDMNALSDNLTRHVERSRVILTLRYLNLQLLIYRPALASALAPHMKGTTENPPSSSRRTLQSDFVDDCTRSSEEIIAILHFLIISCPQGSQLLGVWWFSLYYGKRSQEWTNVKSSM